MHKSNSTVEELFEKAFPDNAYKLTKVSDDNLKITSLDGLTDFSFVFDNEELGLEIDNVVFDEDYFTIGEKYVNFILIDSENSLANQVIKIDGSLFSGIVHSKHESLYLLLNNWESIKDVKKATEGEQKSIGEIINDRVVICELQLKTTELIIDSTEIVDQIINSVLSFLSFEKGINLDNPRNILNLSLGKIKNLSDVINIKIIKDSEPMLYFLSAERIGYPHLKYLEYYHVIEYYFLHKRMEDIERIIQELIVVKLANSGHKSQAYYKNLTELMSYYLPDKKENELDQLSYVIRNDLGYNTISEYLNNNLDELNFLGTIIFGINKTKIELNSVQEIHKVEITGGRKTKDVINLKSYDKCDEITRDNFCNKLAERIYYVRNQVVHTKKFEWGNVFTPTQSNFSDLASDVSLIPGFPPSHNEAGGATPKFA